MKIQIKPISIGLPNLMATQIQFRVVSGDSSRLFCPLFDENNNQIGFSELEIPNEIQSSWGVDDNVIIDYALNELGLERL